jgi:membrane protein
MVDVTARLRKAAVRPVATGKAVLAQVREDDVPFMAGSIAYNAFVSLVPLLVLLFLVITAAGDEAFANRAVALTEGFLPDAGQALLREAIAGSGEFGGLGASIVGSVTLLWGSLKIFRGLDTAFSSIYETGGENSLIDQLRDGLIVLVVLGVSVAVMAAAGTLFAALEGPLARGLNLLLLLVGLTVAFLPIYRYFPDADLGWRDAVPGAVFAALGWTALQALFQFYVALSSSASGAIGAVVLLLTWLYLAGAVLLVGGVINAVLLGEGAPTPKTARGSGVGSQSGSAAAASALPRSDDAGVQEAPRVVAWDERLGLARELDHERDRRQRLEHELSRLQSRLAARDAGEVAALERRNRLLRRRLAWERKPLPVRLALGRLGGEPPDPTARPVPAPRRLDDGRAAGG